MPLGSDVKKQIKPEELEELLNGLERLLDRTKVLYEQYFMGIQKLAPMQLHRDVERKVRELMQAQMRNTALRFRFTTVCQKFGSYNTYWKRTLREIEQGKYVRELKRVKRKADQKGEELPEELLVKLPRLMQDRIRRDRERMAERADSAAERDAQAGSPQMTELSDEALALHEVSEVNARTLHEISEAELETLFSEGDLDMDGLFQAMTGEPHGTPVRDASPRAAPAAVGSAAMAAVDALEGDDTIDVPADDAPDADGWSAPQAEATEASAEEPAAADASEPVRTAPPAMTSPLGRRMATNRPDTSSAESGFRVPLPPGTAARRTNAAPPEPSGASRPEAPAAPEQGAAMPVAAEVTRTRTETLPRVRTPRPEHSPPASLAPTTPASLAPTTPASQSSPPGPQTPPPAPRTATGQQTPPPAPRTATGQQAPPPAPRTATGQAPQQRAATAPPMPPPTPRAATGQIPQQRAATAPPMPPPTPRTATGPRATSTRRAEPPPVPAQALPPGMDDRQCRELYARYLKARQLVGESNEDVTYERLVTSLSKQASAIMTQHSARGVQFHVVVRGDKVVLKAKPLKPGKGE